jgi:hypothetical protein
MRARTPVGPPSETEAQSRSPSRWSYWSSHDPPQARRTAAAPTSPAPHTDPADTASSAAKPSSARRLAALLDRPRLHLRSAGRRGGGAPPPGRRHPPNLMHLQQAPQSAGHGAKLAPHLLHGPRPGDQPVHQVGPHALEAQLGHPGGALLGGTLTLVGELLAARWLVEVLVADGTADGWLGGAKVGGELGDAPAVVQQDLQARAEVGEAQAAGLLLEVAAAAIVDGETALDRQAARQTGCWWCFPCARSAGSPAAWEVRPDEITCGDERIVGRGEPTHVGNVAVCRNSRRRRWRGRGHTQGVGGPDAQLRPMIHVLVLHGHPLVPATIDFWHPRVSAGSLDIHHVMRASQVGDQTGGRVARVLGPALHCG